MPIQPDTLPPTPTDLPQRPRSVWRELPLLLGVAIVVAIVVRAFVVQTFFIPSGSMENTLEINNRVLVNKLVYDFHDPHRGDIIVFKAPTSWQSDPSKEDFIKRVIGLPGDHVVCCDAQNRITVNGTPLDETYLYSDATGRDKPSDSKFDVVVPAARLWVMGDHRSQSADSHDAFKRTNGDVTASTIPIRSVVGRAFALFWPFNRADWLSVPSTFDNVPAPPGD